MLKTEYPLRALKEVFAPLATFFHLCYLDYHKLIKQAVGWVNQQLSGS
jgi:hypothetical protein